MSTLRPAVITAPWAITAFETALAYPIATVMLTALLLAFGPRRPCVAYTSTSLWEVVVIATSPAATILASLAMLTSAVGFDCP